MNRRPTLLLLSFVVTAGLLFAAGCDTAGSSMNDADNSDDADNGSDGPTTLQVHLTDAPGDVVKAEVLIERVSIVSEEDAEEDTTESDTTESDTSETESTGVSVLSDEDFRVDLTKLEGEVDTLMGELEIESGTYSQIRLITAHPDSFDVRYETTQGDTAKANLKIPSGSQSGIKVDLVPPITMGTGLDTVDVTLDFSVKDSFIPRGPEGRTSDYNFKPTVTALIDSSNTES